MCVLASVWVNKTTSMQLVTGVNVSISEGLSQVEDPRRSPPDLQALHLLGFIFSVPTNG